jgi:putative membrane protein
MRKLIVAAAVLALMSAASAQSVSSQDKASQKFLTKAIEGNFAEVSMGQLAQQNAQSQDVKDYGQMLVTDHGAANQQAQQAASSIGLSNPPTGPNKKQMADHDKLAKLNGTAFDRAFARHMVQDHKKDIAEYKKEARHSDAAGDYAKATLPNLDKHLKGAQTLAK